MSHEAPSMPEWSIVSTMYRSREFLEPFLERCLEAMRLVDCHDFEIVLVNDGSPDESLAYALERRNDIPQLVVVDLSRNFGHHHAMQAGLSVARGSMVFIIDCDLEVDPTVLPGLVAKRRETGADVVLGYQEARKGGAFEQASGALFWKGFNLMSDTKVRESMLTERIMTRRFVDALLTMGDRNLFMGGMMAWAGFTQVGIPIPKGQREGASTYSVLRRVQLMINAVSSFSSKPLIWLFNAGVVITLASFAYAAYLVIRRLAFGDTLLGFTSIMALIALSLGILTTGLGILGIYLGKIFNQVQGRPTFIIRDIHQARNSAAQESVETPWVEAIR